MAADTADNTPRSAGPLERAFKIRPGELRPVLLACAYFYFVLTSYSILRPIRDEMGAAGGVDNLAWLFTGTLVAMVLVQPVFGGLVCLLRRRTFIAVTYRFFMLNLLGFWALLHLLPETQHVWIGRAFFIWASVFNLFVVSIFWAYMADLFQTEQGKRLFGLIAIGGTLGAVSGAAVTAFLAELIQPANLLLASMVLLEISVWSVWLIGRHAGDPTHQPELGAAARDERQPIGGSIWAGLTHVVRSPYLLGICGFIVLFTVGSTYLYFQQAEIVNQYFTDRGQRTSYFARRDLAVNVLTLLGQLFLTARLMRWLGVGATLALLPAISLIGFSALALAPTLGVLITFEVLRRASNFALSRPAREVLFTVLPREDKYKGKSFIDTFVYRAGDQVGAWSYAAMGAVGLGVAGIATVAVPLSAAWLAISLWLGRQQRKLAGRAGAGTQTPPAPTAFAPSLPGRQA